jgi:plasmid stabilization system protein ParE
MPRIELAPEVFDDFDRFFDHQEKHGIEDTSGRIAEINEAIQVLAHSPLIGRKAKTGKRELVIGKESRGYVALYRYVPDIDTVFVLAIRSQRESGYR